MNERQTDPWPAENRRRLMAEVAALEAHLAVGATATADDTGPVEDAGPMDVAAIDAAPPLDPPARLDSLSAVFGLAAVDRLILSLAVSDALGGRAERRASVGLALDLGGEAAQAALCPQGPLRRWRLVEIEARGAFTDGLLRLDERILHHLLGVDYLDARLDGVVAPVPRRGVLGDAEAALVGRLARLWCPTDEGWPVLQLCGGGAETLRAVAVALAEARGLRLLRVARDDIPRGAYERLALARLADREMALSGAALVVEGEGGEGEDRAAAAFVDLLLGPTLVAAGEPLSLQRTPRLRADVAVATVADRRLIWSHEIVDGALDADEVGRLAEQFTLDRAGIRAVVEGAADGDGAAFPRLWAGARAQARRRLDGLAERIETHAAWDDLVLPADRLTQLRDIAVHVRRAHQVHEGWGWAARGARGLGVAALFAGPSGTGKTLAAELLAGELGLDLYRVDLSQVVSKYIGETEKNLRRIFEAAEAGGAVLLFDEADALFGKRSDVKDSHDRYANVEVSYLLQRMEAYRGLAVLTTNMKGSLDIGFLRRLRFVVDFPFPDAALRGEIWRRVFPRETPLGEIDTPRLARLAVAGGAIRTIAVNAAFLAAEEGASVETRHLVLAARREYAKLEKPVTATEFGGLG